MKSLWEAIIRGYLKVIAPVADWMVRKRINPNTITTVGTICSVIAGAIFAAGHIRTAAWVLGLTALFALGAYSFWSSRYAGRLPAGHPDRMDG